MLYWTFLKEFKDLPQRREGAKNKNLKDFSNTILFTPEQKTSRWRSFFIF